ncbi:hypothetical protein L7F22_034094 [Adiantum nelumboides]|nr:hypothetical protein [Adiantum nelumboides]
MLPHAFRHKIEIRVSRRTPSTCICLRQSSASSPSPFSAYRAVKVFHRTIFLDETELSTFLATRKEPHLAYMSIRALPIKTSQRRPFTSHMVAHSPDSLPLLLTLIHAHLLDALHFLLNTQGSHQGNFSPFRCSRWSCKAAHLIPATTPPSSPVVLLEPSTKTPWQSCLLAHPTGRSLTSPLHTFFSIALAASFSHMASGSSLASSTRHGNLFNINFLLFLYS